MKKNGNYNVVLGVTGGIACYKSASVVSALCKEGINVDVIMTRNATEFVGPDDISNTLKKPGDRGYI